MPSANLDNKKVAVLGAGSFGTAIANLLARNVDVILYTRREEIVKSINQDHTHLGVELSPRIEACMDLKQIADTCTVLFPVVPSEHFRSLMQDLAPFVRPYHIMIHGTKGFDIGDLDMDDLKKLDISRKHVSTMSEVITQETVVVRTGCLSGPNLASEIIEGQPTATVIGSRFEEVIDIGKRVLTSHKFHVFGTADLLGAELAGALKNIIAIGSGVLRGIGLGKNIQAMLITRGLIEMVHFGKAMGATSEAFFGTAGIGDLVATATSKDSRNFTFGYRLGKGDTFEDIQKTMPELAEGVRTLQIAQMLAKHYKLHVPITTTIYKVVFEGMEISRALEFLMRYPYDVDVDFLEGKI
ncbi:MAG: NAD(P)-dependent glycerol-3-phosphate dehydrogenase [Saprospiraceae bacterium]|nr:NAD(P)-dependent glycerol-3-phosphate dehydrogenase [Saprospiraceae bacterium]